MFIANLVLESIHFEYKKIYPKKKLNWLWDIDFFSNTLAINNQDQKNKRKKKQILELLSAKLNSTRCIKIGPWTLALLTKILVINLNYFKQIVNFKFQNEK